MLIAVLDLNYFDVYNNMTLATAFTDESILRKAFGKRRRKVHPPEQCQSDGRVQQMPFKPTSSAEYWRMDD